MSPTQRFTQVDAFTDRPFEGNPAAVCVLPSARDARWMQQVALEMNLAETAFLVRRPDGFDLRWFTPGAEVDLCGHATLASAHALWEDGHLQQPEAPSFTPAAAFSPRHDVARSSGSTSRRLQYPPPVRHPGWNRRWAPG